MTAVGHGTCSATAKSAALYWRFSKERRHLPVVRTIHRWVKAAGIAAGEFSTNWIALAGRWCCWAVSLTRSSSTANQSWWGSNPHSMVWFLGKKADNHQGSILVGVNCNPGPRLRYVTSDAGTGLKAGIAQMQRHQRQLNQVPLENGLDVFHTKREGRRVLNIMWQRVERCWELAEVASRAVEKQRQQGISVRGKTYPEHLACGAFAVSAFCAFAVSAFVFCFRLPRPALGFWSFPRHSALSRCQPLFFVFDCPGRRLDFGVFRVIGR